MKDKLKDVHSLPFNDLNDGNYCLIEEMRCSVLNVAALYLLL